MRKIDDWRRRLPYLALAAALTFLLGAASVFLERLRATPEGQARAAGEEAQGGQTEGATSGGGADGMASAGEDSPLADAVSPYLRMHADNPVDWHTWGEAAFRKAREQDKPIFLSVGYYTCYWCHVMEREAFTDEAVAELLNEHFVSIKVDREQRPAVDALYMRALQVMQQGGGWPMSVFLTPDLEPFFGGTYFPTDRFQRALEQIQQAWANDRERITQTADRVASALERSNQMVGVDGGGAIPEAGLADEAQKGLASSFDPDHGGFSEAPKFPQPSTLAFLLDRFEGTQDEEALDMATTTLDAMAAGGVYDQIGGGFHRYATDGRWRVPHFEKMLYGNAQLLGVYTRAWQLTDKPRYRQVAAGIIEYVSRVLQDTETGLFYSAQSSLVDGVEGKTYTWTREQVAAALDSDRLTQIALRHYGLDGEAEMTEEGTHVLYRARAPKAVAEGLDGVSARDVENALPRIDEQLLAARQQRQQPSVGTKHVLAWNAYMIESLAQAGTAFDEPAYIDRAKRAAQGLREHLYALDDGPLHAIRDGRGDVRAQLSDYAALAHAQLALADATGDLKWRDRAAATAEDMIAALWNPQRGLFDRRADAGNLLVQTTEMRDGAVPGGNSLAVAALTELAARGETRFAAYAATTLRAHEGIMQRKPASLTYMISGLMRYRGADLSGDSDVPRGPIATAGGSE